MEEETIKTGQGEGSHLLKREIQFQLDVIFGSRKGNRIIDLIKLKIGDHSSDDIKPSVPSSA
jgi:hypothetical protein